MTERTLKPPARFSHGVLVTLVLAIALLLTGAIGQRPTLLIGSVTLVVFLAGFWAFSREQWFYTAGGTVAVILGGFGVLLTGARLVLGALGAPTAISALMSAVVTLAVLASVVAVAGDLIPTTVTRQDGSAIVGLVYGGGLAGTIVVTITALQLSVASLFGQSASSVVETNLEWLLAAMTLNPVARAGSLALIAGVGLWYATRLWTLPLGRRLSRGVALRWAELNAGDAGAGSEGAIGAEDGKVEGETATRGPDSRPPTISSVLGRGARFPAALRWTGAAAFYLGLGALILGLTPEMQGAIEGHPVAMTLGSVLGEAAGTHRSLLRLIVTLGGLRVAHAIAWRGLNVDWAASGRRLGYGIGGVVVVVGAALAGQYVVEFLLETPALQLVPMGETGPVVVATDAGLQPAESGLAGFSLEHRPEVFEPWFGRLVELLSPAVFGIGLLTIGVASSVLVLVVATMAAAGAGLTRPGAGIGLLFVASAGGAVIGVNERLALGAGSAALIAWELYTYGGSLNRQLDPKASTLSAELVHLGASVVLVGIAIILTLAGLRAVRAVPTPPTEWQVMGALALSLTVSVLGLLYLGLWGDRSAERARAS